LVPYIKCPTAGFTCPEPKAKGQVEAVVGPQLLVLNARQPSAHVWLMVIMEMVKEFTRAEALTAQPYNVVRWLDQDVIG